MLFRVEVSNQSPLQLRLTAPASGSVELQEWSAYGETGLGQTSRPLLYRPSSPGVARASGETAVVSRLDSGAEKVEPAASVASVFSIAPSLPDVSIASTNLPFRVGGRWPKGFGPILRAGESLILYARTDFENQKVDDTQNPTSDVIHTWSASMHWEEL